MAAIDFKNMTEKLVSVCRGVIGNGYSIAVTGHDLPDADSIISAVMMKMALEKFGISSKIKFGTHPDRVTLRDMERLSLLGDVSFDGFDEGDRLLLVDHHKSFYTIPVFACVDHHTTLPEPEGEVAIVVPASSCGRVIVDMGEACRVADAELEKLAIYSVYLDTQSCQSPKFQKSDVEWLDSGIRRYGIDKDELTRMGYVLCDADEEISVLSTYGFKKYSFGAMPAFSSCIQIDADDKVWDGVILKIIEHLSARLGEEGGSVWAFVINKPIEARSDIYFIDRLGGVEKVALDRLASRSRDVIPVICSAI